MNTDFFFDFLHFFFLLGLFFFDRVLQDDGRTS